MAQDNKTNDRVEKVLDMVKKLFALADKSKNPSEAEAEAAALKAQQLIAKYNLTITDEDEKLEITETSFTTGIDKSWKYNLAHIICNNFRVRCYWVAKKRVCFYGYKQDTEVAREVFQFLFKVGEKNARHHCRIAYNTTGTETGVYFSYTRGFLEGLKQKLDAQCTALIIVTPPEVNAAYETMCSDKGLTTLGKYRSGSEGFDRSIYNQGIKDGRSAMNSRSIEGGGG